MTLNNSHIGWLCPTAYLLVLWLLAACVPTVLPPSSLLGQPQTENPAVLVVRQVLTQQLQADPATVAVVSVEEKMWPTSCLGAFHADDLCAQAPTPGYRITLRVNGNDYVYHTTQDGGFQRLVTAPEVALGESILTWQGSDAWGCQTLVAGSDSMAFGPCGGLLMGAPYPVDMRQAALTEFAILYQSFNAATSAGTVDFVGAGTAVATLAEQRMIAEWAYLVYLGAQGGRSGASWGIVFTWQREGGIAGFCDEVSVYVTGEAYVTSCKGSQPKAMGRVRLDATQLATLYRWIDTLQAFDMEQGDTGVADSMTMRIVFSGRGTTSATEADLQAITDLAQTLIAQARAAANVNATGEPTIATLNYYSPAGGFTIRYPATAVFMENVRPSVDGALAQAANTVAFVNGSPNYALTITWFDLADRTVLRRFTDAYSECAAITGTAGQPLDINGHAALLFPEAPCGPFTTTYIFTVFELRGYRISVETMDTYADVQGAVEAVVATMQFLPPALPQ